MREKVNRIREGLADPEVAYRRAKSLAEEAVALEKLESIYVGSAIDNLTREGEFGSWLKKLYRGDKVTIHLHFYERLCRIIEDRADRARRRAEHVEAILSLMGRADAVGKGNRQLDTAELESSAA